MPVQVGNQDHEESGNQSRTKALSLGDVSKRFEVARAGHAPSCAQPVDLLSGIEPNNRSEETVATTTSSTFVRHTGIGRRWEDVGHANLRAPVEPPAAQPANLDCADEKDQPESAEPTSNALVKGVFFSACKYINGYKLNMLTVCVPLCTPVTRRVHSNEHSFESLLEKS